MVQARQTSAQVSELVIDKFPASTIPAFSHRFRFGIWTDDFSAFSHIYFYEDKNTYYLLNRPTHMVLKLP